MAIVGFTKERFIETLNKHLSVSEPISSIELLFGREEELDRIEKALYIPGRHIFIYGDRGVGKSSLAATAASQYQSSDKPYIDIACGPDSTFYTIIANIVYQGIEADRLYNIKTNNSAKFTYKGLSLSSDKSVSLKDIKKEITELIDAVELLRIVAEIHSENPVVVIDEFDRISDAKERALFADLLKHLGDKKIHIKFIFTGIAKSLDELLGAHASAIRQLETIELGRLSINARWEILDYAAHAFNLTVHRNVEVKIGLVSDGFPYYAHLLSNKILWRVFEQKENVDEIGLEHYIAAVEDAIESVNVELKRPYELAIFQRTDDYEVVLWATADSDNLYRYIDDMYQSYLIISDKYQNSSLSKQQFYSRIKNLQKEQFGEIITAGFKRGLYTYKEKMVRGYVRLQAEAHGVELNGEEAKRPKEIGAKSPVSVRKGYHTSKVPAGVKFRSEEKK